MISKKKSHLLKDKKSIITVFQSISIASQGNTHITVLYFTALFSSSHTLEHRSRQKDGQVNCTNDDASIMDYDCKSCVFCEHCHHNVHNGNHKHHHGYIITNPFQ